MGLPWRAFAAALLLSSVPIAFAGCAATHSRETSRVDPKLSQFSYIEDGNLVALVASTRPARYRHTRPYLPIEFAVVNKGLKSLRLTRESFTLRDDTGLEYPAVGRDELAKEYGNTDVDRRYGDALPFVNQRYSSYTLAASNFTPGFDAGIARDNIFLPRFSYIVDFLYFPRPSGDLGNRVFELVVRSDDLPDPVFVKFVLDLRE